MWEDIVKIFLQHPLACLISVPSAVYLTFISARGINRDTKRRNEKLGIIIPKGLQDDSELILYAVLILFAFFLVLCYFTLTLLGSVLPIKFGI